MKTATTDAAGRMTTGQQERMTQSHLESTIKNLAFPLAAGLGLDIWGIELAFGGRSLVRVYVERQPGASPALESDAETEYLESTEQGVSVEQCAELSRLLGLSLEVEDIIPGAYILEVSSPGLERTFFTEAQLAAAVGKLVDVQLDRPLQIMPDRRKFRGVIIGVSSALGADGVFTIKAEDCPKPGMEKDVSFTFAEIKKARQVWLPPEKTLPGKGGKAKGKKNAPCGDTDAAERSGLSHEGAGAPEDA